MIKDGNRPAVLRADRGDATREKLLNTAIDVFGRYGFDGATTRKLADAAGVNLRRFLIISAARKGFM